MNFHRRTRDHRRSGVPSEVHCARIAAIIKGEKTGIMAEILGLSFKEQQGEKSRTSQRPVLRMELTHNKPTGGTSDVVLAPQQCTDSVVASM